MSDLKGQSIMPNVQMPKGQLDKAYIPKVDVLKAYTLSYLE